MSKTTILKTLFITIFISSLFMSFSFVVSAQDEDSGDEGESSEESSSSAGEFDYTPISPISELGINEGGTDLGPYLNSLYKGGIIIATMLAVLMLTIGAIEYMGSESVFTKSNGKHRMTMAILGLILALSSYLILATIDEDFLNSDISEIESVTLEGNAPDVEGGTSGSSGGSGTAQSGWGDDEGGDDHDDDHGSQPATQGEGAYETEAEARAALSAMGVSTNNSSSSDSRTLVGDLPQKVFDELGAIKQTNPNVELVVTGGNEDGHQTHGAGKAIIDLRPTSSLNSYLGSASPYEGQVITKGGGRYTYEDGVTSGSGAHWHVVY